MFLFTIQIMTDRSGVVVDHHRTIGVQVADNGIQTRLRSYRLEPAFPNDDGYTFAFLKPKLEGRIAFRHGGDAGRKN